MVRLFIISAAIGGFTAVAIGAFAAHGLQQYLQPSALEAVNTAVRYQFYHTLALLFVALWLMQKPTVFYLKAAGLSFILGSLFFSASLYALALGAPRWLGPITPLGGLFLLLGWVLLALAAWRTQMKR